MSTFAVMPELFSMADSPINPSSLAGSLIYEKLGERAFGWPGKMAAFGSIILQNIGGRQWFHVGVCV